MSRKLATTVTIRLSHAEAAAVDAMFRHRHKLRRLGRGFGGTGNTLEAWAKHLFLQSVVSEDPITDLPNLKAQVEIEAAAAALRRRGYK